MTGKLLVALDGSPRTEGVLRAAAALARRTGDKLVLLRATHVAGELPVEAYASDPEAIAGVLADRAIDELERLAARLPTGLVGAVRAERGPAWRIIEEVAAEEDVDMIVIGAHGYGTVERMLGTVAAKVVDHADRPVLVVRDPDRLV